MSLAQVAKQYYENENFNCCETIIHAANDYYNLSIEPEDMKLFAGFGGGMFSGQVCGALVACVAALSKRYIQTKAHEQLDVLKPADQQMVQNFKNKLDGTTCAQVKPIHFDKEVRCLHTVEAACDALEETIASIDAALEA
jgi:C_GCAxxG_C_C family probable redox protein